MSHALLQASPLSHFRCLGDACEDTCCKGWGMQLSAHTVALYKAKAPELLDAVASGEAEHIMRRDETTDYCVKYDKGWCGIHAKYGEDFLGDACHFFPRVTRRLGGQALMSASLSCPEIARLSLLQNASALSYEVTDIDRLPDSLKDYLPEGLDQEKALTLHRFFVEACADESISAPRIMVRLRSVAASLQAVEVASWGVAAPFYWGNADARLPTAQADANDLFHLLHALQGLVAAARKSPRERLMHTMQQMAFALRCELDWDALTLLPADNAMAAAQSLQQRWRQAWQAPLQPFLRRWLAMQLSVMCFPFAGLGDTLEDRMTLLGVRFATLQLALMATCDAQGQLLSDAEAVRVVQSLARFMDHLADPTLSLAIYAETGWVREPRLRALIGDY
jgi:lysine-N-methylase